VSSVLTTVTTLREAKDKLGADGLRKLLKVSAEVGTAEEVEQLVQQLG
jgi:hypothetical protein